MPWILSYNKNYLPLGNKVVNFNSSPAGYFKAPKQGLEKSLDGEGSKGDILEDNNLLNLLGANTYSPAGYTILIVYQPQLQGNEVLEDDKIDQLARKIKRELASMNLQVQ